VTPHGLSVRLPSALLEAAASKTDLYSTTFVGFDSWEEVAERVLADGLMDWAATRSGPGSPRRRWRRRRTSDGGTDRSSRRRREHHQLVGRGLQRPPPAWLGPERIWILQVATATHARTRRRKNREITMGN
jgi:hypothetical protein